MKRLCYVFLVSGLITLSACKKDSTEASFDNIFYKPYATGIIKFEYQIPVRRFSNSTLKDTIVQFTSIGNNPLEKDDYGYSKPSNLWVQLHRLNQKDFQNRTFIFFVRTNLNELNLPFTFKKGDMQNAQINYVIGLHSYLDANGNLINGANTYAASTYSDNFEMTVLSKVNGRLQGIFSGDIKNQEGLTINIKRGLFDIEYIDK